MSVGSQKEKLNSKMNGWFKPEIDRKLLKELLTRSDYEGWKHIIIYFLILFVLGSLCFYFWGLGGF